MAQAPAYNREKNFTLNSGRETDHAALNAELDRASNSINDIRFNLAILQADDGKLRPSVVTADSISQELRVSLVEGVVTDAQTMLDRSLAAADASSNSAIAAKASEEAAKSSSEIAVESAKALSLAVNSDWNATGGAAQILNKPELSVVAISGHYDDLEGKPDNLASTEDIALLQEEIAKKGVPVGTVEYFALTTPPPGYLKADGAAVGRETYPDLFAAIGTTFGEGDGQTTFNLPDLIDRFAQGSNTPGQKIEAGLPNITGKAGQGCQWVKIGAIFEGAFEMNATTNAGFSSSTEYSGPVSFDASRSNPTYGASDTVQPPALTLLPCIKAFDAATNPGLIDITGLAQEMADKTDSMAAAHAAMPSDRYVDLTLVSGSEYTAPSDGFFTLQGWSPNAYALGLYVWNASVTLMKANNCVHMGKTSTDLQGATVQVSKGDKVYAYLSGTVTVFRFVYANGGA